MKDHIKIKAKTTWKLQQKYDITAKTKQKTENKLKATKIHIVIKCQESKKYRLKRKNRN